MNKIVFGKYLPLDSPIHKLDPRAKILAMMVMLVAVFMPAGWYGYIIIALILSLVTVLAKIKFTYIYRSFKPMMMMVIFLLIINIFSLKEGTMLIKLGFIEIYSSALIQTFYIATRLVLMIMITTLLTFTTKPLELTLGIEYVLTPFTKLGLPSHEIAMIISIALRFIPTIIEETMRIMNSQKSRGVDFEEGKLKEKISAIISLIVPLFSVSLLRADELANAMEARGYVPQAPRTRYRRLKYERRDLILVIGAFLLLALMITLAIVI